MGITKTPLTQNQHLVWIGQELNPGSPMYNMVMTYEIKGAISLPVFRKAFDRLVSSSDALRSVFETQNNEVFQSYKEEIKYKVEYLNFSNEENPREIYTKWVEERVKHSFNLEQLAFDSVLIKLSQEVYVWYFNQHHLITDGWSTAIAFQELSKNYKEIIDGSDVEIKSLPNFSDFAVEISQKEKLTSISETRTYWKQKVSGLTDVPKLYYKSTSNLNTSSKRIKLDLGKERSESLKAFANKKGVRVWTLDLTLYNIFLTALFAYIHRISGQKDIIIGSPSHNRTSKSYQKTIGFFVEIFPLITSISDDETFMSLLKKIQVESNSFLKNAKTGGSSSQVNRNFNVFYNYMLNTSNTDFGDFTVNTEWVHPEHTDPRHHFRLHVHDLDNTGEIKLYLDLNTSVFNKTLQQEVPQHFLNIIDAFISNENQKIETVGFATLNEISKIRQWNNTTVNFGNGETLLNKFENQIAQSPENIALQFKNTQLTYKTFNEKVNQVAHFLQSEGVKPNDIVAVSLDRSLEMMVCIYGIIKAGAAYLPIDTKTPEKRVAFILEDSRAKLFLCNHDNYKNIDYRDCQYHSINNLEKAVNTFSTASFKSNSRPESLAYVIYTSGSTGKPKGVKVSHKAICNRLQWMDRDYPVNKTDVFLQKTPITFDVSVWELFWPLQIGAKLVIEIPDGHKNPEQLIATIQENKVSQIHFVPSMLGVFISTDKVESCVSLKRIFCSGEALSATVVKNTYNLLNVEIHNLYGPTEAAVDVSSWYCDPKLIDLGVLIGKAVANTQLYILDQNLNQLPIGILGELHIGGLQLASGYLNNDKLTEEKFIPNIFSSASDSRLYKTGDLAKFREDGNIEYLGRIDTQVKIRGLRVELGEIETTLENIDTVTKAIVIVEEKKNSLVAYYTGIETSENTFLNALSVDLPEYMYPTRFINIASFNYLSSGKIDRKKLPLTSLNTSQAMQTKQQPTNEFEQLIHEIWIEVLELDTIGINENFVRIGGNSLNAISITSRLKAELELVVSITDVFNYPTIKLYAAQLKQTIEKLMSEES